MTHTRAFFGFVAVMQLLIGVLAWSDSIAEQLCDGPIHQTGRQQVFFGARGELSLDVVVYGPNHGLHSGHYGNWAPNPISLLTHLLDSMRDTEARILIPRFYADVQQLRQ